MCHWFSAASTVWTVYKVYMCNNAAAVNLNQDSQLYWRYGWVSHIGLIFQTLCCKAVSVVASPVINKVQQAGVQ